MHRAKLVGLTGLHSGASESQSGQLSSQKTLTNYYRYQRAFVDFFEDQLVNTDYNWQLLLKDFLFDKHYALIYGVTGGCRCYPLFGATS